MNRARRSVAVYNRKTPKQVSDDDFESVDGLTDEQDEDDFSVSEDEWLPNKENGDRKYKEKPTSDVDDDDDEYVSELTSDSPNTEDETDGSVVVSDNKSKKRAIKASSVSIPKKKRLSPATRNELYLRTKKNLLKETDPEMPLLNSSVADYLKQYQFKKKIDRSSEVILPRAKSTKKPQKNGDSDSSGDDHLMKPEDLDLASNFFDKIEPKQLQLSTPNFDCNAGMRLSDSSDNDDVTEESIPASIEKVAAQQLINKINETSSDFVNFNNLGEFNKKIEEAKRMLKNYQANESVEQAQIKKEDVSNLLALGETEAGISPEKYNKQSGRNETDSEESDWEEVEDTKKSQSTDKPSEYEVTIEVQTTKSKKKRWEEIEMELFIKRQINKVKRANQLAFHKSSVLCAIAGGKKFNEIINSPAIQARALSFMQSDHCSLKGKLDGKFVDQMMKWFKSQFELTDLQVLNAKASKVSFTLALELFTQKITCKRDYVLLFLACLRAAGVDCRLIISANVPPKRPAMKDLCPISERQLLEKFEKEFGKNSSVIITKEPNNKICIQDADNESKIDTKNCAALEPKSVTDNQKKEKKSSTCLEITPEKEVNQNKSTRESQNTQENNETKTTKSTNPCTLSVSKVHVIEEKHPRRCSSRKNIQSLQKPSTRTSSEKSNSASNSFAKENPGFKNSTRKGTSPRIARNALCLSTNSLKVPQLDGVSDLVTLTPPSVPISRRLRSRTKSTAAESKAPFTKRASNTPTMPKEMNNNQPGRVSKRKLFVANKSDNDPIQRTNPTANVEPKLKSNKNKILSSDSSDDASSAMHKKRQSHGARLKSKPSPSSSEDSDFEPPGKKKAKRTAKAKSESPNKQSKQTKKKNSPKSASNKAEKECTESASANKMDFWIEFYSEKDKRWITVDLFSGKINCVEYLARHATSPISYVFGFDNANHIKDITPRYVQHWNTVSRMLRVEPKWLATTLKPFQAKKTSREKQEDEELNKIDIDKPLPTTIAECKNHPLYVLKRHLLKFEAIYPADAPSLGFVRGEAIYARECLFVLQTREKWYKQGRVVRPFETAYKIVKCWRYDKSKNEWKGNQPCEIFGKWQTDEYDPPTAENGLVPRNEYGNVELFTPKMLPKKTVHLQLPGLNKVCKRLGIDCAPALTGFEKARMRMIPVYDGFVVCEEFANQIVEEWYKEMEEEERREQEKYEKRVYGNWKRLIKGLLVRRKLQNKYNFDNL